MNAYQAMEIYKTLFLALQDECNQKEYCDTHCKFYDKEEAICLLKHCPCDYDISRIEEALYYMIKEEIENV